MINQELIQYLKTRVRVYPNWIPERIKTRVITVFPYIFVNNEVNIEDKAFEAILLHENVHLIQQSAGPRWIPVICRLMFFICKYGDKEQRLMIEAEGIAREIEANEWPIFKQQLFDAYCQALIGADYDHCASDVSEAASAIRMALIDIDSEWIPTI